MLRFRIAFAVVAVLISFIARAGKVTHDNVTLQLTAMMDTLEKHANETFGHDVLNKFDRPVQLDNDHYKNLLAEVSKAQTAIQDASYTRTSEENIHAFSEIVLRYFALQKRLWYNYLWEIHSHIGQESQFQADLYSKYNLKIDAGLGTSLFLDDSLSLRFNIWHSKEEPAHLVEIGLNRLDLSHLEESVLLAHGDSDNYKKLIQLLVVRERIVNYRAVQRFSGPMQSPSLISCGVNLVSFSEKSNSSSRFPGTILDTQNSWDLYSDFSNVQAPVLAAATYNKPLIAENNFESFVRGFFENYEEYKFKIAGQTADEEQQTRKNILAYLDSEEVEWQAKSANAILSTSFPSDDWSSAGVVNRVSDIIYLYKRNKLIDLLLSQSSEFIKNELENHPAAVYDAIEHYVDQTLAPIRATWIFGLKVSLFQALLSNDTKLKISEQDQVRMNELIHELQPAIDDIQSHKQIAADLHHFDGELLYKELQGTATLVDRFFPKELAYIIHPSHDALAKPIRDLRIEDLGFWIEKKIDFFIKTREIPLAMQLRANQIHDDARIARIFSDFETRFANQYALALVNTLAATPLTSTGPQPDLSDIHLTNSSLHKMLAEAAIESVRAFKVRMRQLTEAIIKNPDPVPTPAGFADQIMVENYAHFAAPVTSSHAPFIQKIIPEYSGSEKEQQAFFRELAEAFSIVYLGDEVAKELNITVPKIPIHTGESPIQTLTDVEHYQKQNTKGDDSFALSLLDQKILSEIRKTQAIAKFAILRTPMSAEDGDAPTLATSIENTSENPQNLIKKSFNIASRLSPGLISSACAAKPLVLDDENYRNLFSAAQNIRASLMLTSKSAAKNDTAAVKFTRTPWKRILDAWTPAIIVAALALSVIMVIEAPILLGSLASFASTGDFTAGMVGARTLFGAGELWSNATSSSGLMTLLLSKTSITVWASLILAVQPVSMFYMNVYELPAQVKYQLHVSAANIGLYAVNEAEANDVKKFAHDVRWAPYKAMGMMTMIAAPAIPLIYISARTVSGITSGLALSRLGEVTSTEGIGVKTLSQFIDESGNFKGTFKYVEQQWSSLVENGRILTLKAGVTLSQLYEVLVPNLVRFFSTPEKLETALTSRIEFLADTTRASLERAKSLGLSFETGTFSTNDATNFTEQLQNLLIKHGIRGDWRKIAIERSALLTQDSEPVELIYNETTDSYEAVSESEAAGKGIFKNKIDAAQFHALILTIHAHQLMIEQMILMRLLTGIRTIGNLSTFFNGLNNEEWSVLRTMCKWMVKSNSTNPLGQHFLWAATGPEEMMQLKQIMQDFDKLVEEATPLQEDINGNSLVFNQLEP